MKRVKRWLKHNVGWVVLKTVIFIINILPLKILYGLANGLAGLAWILGVRRQIVFNNLNRAFGREKDSHEIRAIARETYRNIAKSICELLRAFKFSQTEINKMFAIQGRKYLDTALAQGKGVIGLSAHLGNFPLMGAKLVQEGYPCTSFIRIASDARVVKLFFNIGRHLGINLIPASPSPTLVRQSLKWLRENKILCIQADRDSPQGVFVDFFGYPAATPIGPVVLAKRTGAAVLPMFVVRETNDKHRIIFGPPVELKVTGNKEKDILVNSAKFTKIIESYVKKYPEQWLWTYNRWKTVPPEEKVR
jgi:KDO2-lipid IV(A) lauroyltransferase